MEIVYKIPIVLYTRYPIVARALGLAAFRPSASREQRYLAYNLSSRAALGLPCFVQPLGRVRQASKGILHTIRLSASREQTYLACMQEIFARATHSA